MFETSGTTCMEMFLSAAIRGVTLRIVPRFVYWIDEPAGLFADPGVIWNMGNARVTSSTAVWLSSVTARGVATTWESESLFRNESTALTPSALRNPIGG